MPNFQENNPFQQENVEKLENDINKIGKFYRTLPNIKEIPEGIIGFYMSGNDLYCFVKINNTIYRALFTPV